MCFKLECEKKSHNVEARGPHPKKNLALYKHIIISLFYMVNIIHIWRTFIQNLM